MRAMIALVSDQRMQNVFPVIQQGAKYDELILVLSKDRRTGKPLGRFVKSAEDLKAVLYGYVDQIRIHDTYVDPYDIEAVRSVIFSLINSLSEPRQNMVLNISGGTKPMAIGAFQAAQSAGIKCVYTDTEDGELIWLSPDGTVDKKPIRVFLDVPTYIRAYGETVEESRTPAQLDSQRVRWSLLLMDYYEVLYKQVIHKLLLRFKRETKESGKPVLPFRYEISPTPRQREAIRILAQEGLWDWDESRSLIVVSDMERIKFLDGSWVEVFVAHQLHRSKYFDDVRMNLTLEGVEGEIDVAAVRKGRLVLIECKSNVKRSVQLNKLDAFRKRLGGPYANAYYARASDAYKSRIEKQVRKIRLNGVFFGAELRNVAQKIAQEMGTG